MADYGGGFLHQDSMGDGSSQPHGAGAGPSPPRRFRENKTLTPVTIKQLMTAKASPDDTFKIDEIEVTQVTFVALIRAVNVQPTNVNYTVSFASTMTAHAARALSLIPSRLAVEA